MSATLASRIGIISDTHGLLRPEAIEALRGVDHILHAGDVGDPAILDTLRGLAPVTAISGNIDVEGPCAHLPATEVITLHGHTFYMLHDRHVLDLDPAAAGFSAGDQRPPPPAAHRVAQRRSLHEPGQRRTSTLLPTYFAWSGDHSCWFPAAATGNSAGSIGKISPCSWATMTFTGERSGMENHCFTPPLMAALAAAATSSGGTAEGCGARRSPSSSRRRMAFTMASSLHQRFKCRLALTSNAPRMSSYEEIAGGLDHRWDRRGTTSVVLDATLIQKFMEVARNHCLQQSELIRVVVVEGRPVEGRRLGNILHRDLVEALAPQQVTQSPLEQLAGAVNARIANFTVRNRCHHCY